MKISWKRDTLSADLGAALTVALVSIPEGMAYALVAGVNPVYGLYTGMVSTIVASLTASTSLMVVTLTNALALVTGEQLASLRGDADPVRAMFTLTLLVGVIMFVLGALKLGSVIRFVSREVMSGFVFATALLIILGQYKDLVGYASQLETNKLFKAVDISLHFRDWNTPTMIVGIASIIVLILLKHSPIRKWADITLILLATIFVIITRWQEVELVGDISGIPYGLAALPKPELPAINLIPFLLTGAFAAAVVGLAESSGTGAAYPNPDGTRSKMSIDFTGQGLGNIAGSFFQAMPAGGSLSRTGINASGGAHSRWAGVYSGFLIAIILMLFGHYAELIPMTGLAALLIVIGFEIMLKEGRELVEAWKISRMNVFAAGITILVGVFNDLTVAILTGVILSLLLFAFSAANKFKIVELAWREDGRWEIKPLPEQLVSNRATVIELRGDVYFASVYSFDELLPSSDQTRNTIVILRIRDRSIASLTSLEWIKKYHDKLEAGGNKLMLSGVEDHTYAILEMLEVTERLGTENIYRAEPQLMASTAKALKEAERQIARKMIES